MKSVFILATVVMMMLAGCGSNSDGSFSTSSVDVTTDVSAVESTTQGSTINEPSRVASLPPIPAFPSE